MRALDKFKLPFNVVSRYYCDGEYMYNLVSMDNQSIIVDRNEVIYLIENGFVGNMRVQVYNGNTIIRGKGINLNNLPVYNVNKQQIKKDNIKNTQKNKISNKFTVVKRIVYGSYCIGYVIVDSNNVEKKLREKDIMYLAKRKLLTNVMIQKYKSKSTGESKFVLKGIGCRLDDLPTMLVNKKGQIISDMIEEEFFRVIRVKYNGVIYNLKDNKKMVFSHGDYILFLPSGKVVIKKNSNNIAIIDNDRVSSNIINLCDKYIENASNYSMEIFGYKKMGLTVDFIKRWHIGKIDRAVS